MAIAPSTDRLERGSPLHRQLLDRLLREIDGGTLAPGDRLPTTAALAERFGVTVNTAQQALDTLRRRGLIDRVRGQGTFITRRVRNRTLGVVFGRNIFADPDLQFYQLLLTRLQVVAEGCGWDVRVHFFPLSPADQERLPDALEREVRDGAVRGLVALCCGQGGLRRWLLSEHCTVPWTELTGHLHRELLVDRGFRHLAGRGFRRIAYAPPDAIEPWAGNERQAIARICAELALPMPELLPPGVGERHGFSIMETLVARPGGGRPEAVFFGDNNTCRGAMYALLMAGWSVPRDIAVLTHANRGMPPFFPMPLTRLEHDPDWLARSLLSDIAARTTGDVPPPGDGPGPHLVPGRSCGEPPATEPQP